MSRHNTMKAEYYFNREYLDYSKRLDNILITRRSKQ